MARPKKEGMEYFPHDVDAVNDEKIEMLRSLYGNNGYAFYFIMLERIYRSKNFELDVSDAETREEMFQILSRKMMIKLEEFQKILTTAIKYKCFDKQAYDERGVITSDGIKKRAASVVNKRATMQAKYQKQKDTQRDISDAETSSETMEETPQSKVKESKVKKSKVNNNIINSFTQNEELRIAIEDFIKMRKTIKKPMTERAITLMLNQLDNLADNDALKIDILNQSIQNSWQGVFPLKGGANGYRKDITGGASEESKRLEQYRKEHNIIVTDKNIECDF